MQSQFIARIARRALVALSIVVTSSVTADEFVENGEWAKVFTEYKAVGTMVVSDQRKESAATMVFDKKRAATRFSPASTFKIPHTLFALDAGVIGDEHEVIRWDGKKRAIEAWNKDQTLRTAMQHSVVWVYENFAQQIGEASELGYLKKTGYGNQDPTGKEPFWIEGNLGISALEQVEFLRKLEKNQLPFSESHQNLVKSIMVVESGDDWTLHAKSGWSGTIGWWVGWVEHPSGPVFFALNIDTPNRMKDIPKRELITRRILQSLGALPDN